MTPDEEISRLREALEAATFKLTLYRAAHRGEYVGGMEYGALMKLIARAVLKKPAPIMQRNAVTKESEREDV